jgi:hypothetical protein
VTKLWRRYFNFSVNKGERKATQLNTSASSAAWPARAIVRYRCNFFDTFNAETKPCKRADGCLSTGSGCSGSTAAWSADFDVDGGYAFVSGNFSCASGCAHGSIWGGFHAVCFDEHATAGAGDGFCA